MTAGAAGTQRRAFEMDRHGRLGVRGVHQREGLSWVPYPEGHRKRRGFIANYLDAVKDRESAAGAVYSPSVTKALDGEAFAELRRGATVRFDPSDHDLSDAFLDLIDTSGLVGGDDDAGGIDLATIHERLPDFDRGKSQLEDKARLRAARSTGTATR